MIGPDLTEPIISRPQDRVASKQVAFRASGYQLPRTTPPGTSLRATVDMRGKRRFSDADVASIPYASGERSAVAVE